ncbi:MAG: universal stress protein [Cyanobacteria bacterium P01_F01_bin.150]
MFKKILVALDYSSTSPAVFDKAVDMALAMNAELMLLHVLSSIDNSSPSVLVYPSLSYYSMMDHPFWDDYQERWAEFKSENLEWLKGLTEQAIAHEISAQFTQTHGIPSTSICDVATTWKADLILMGSRGRRGLTELFLGSVSNDVMHQAPCSVLIIQNKDAKVHSDELSDNHRIADPSSYEGWVEV